MVLNYNKEVKLEGKNNSILLIVVYDLLSFVLFMNICHFS